MKTTLLICMFLALRAGAALAANSPWTGDWKLDPAKSHFTGDTFTYSKGPGTLLHFSDGSSTSFDFGLDGKEYKAWANRTVTWTATGNSSWDTETKADGKVLSKGKRVLSADGKTLTMTFSGTKPDGSSFNETDVYQRVSGTDGLIGTWRSIKVSEPGGPREFLITSPEPGVLHYEVPDMKAAAEGRTDGRDNPMTGPTVAPGTTISFKAVSPKKIRYVIKVNGKTDNIGEDILAADGRSFSDVNWNPGKENEKTTGVFVKQ